MLLQGWDRLLGWTRPSCHACEPISRTHRIPSNWRRRRHLPSAESPSKPLHIMPFDAGATTALSAVSGAIVTSIKITEKVFEIIAVGEQTRSLLATINQVNQGLETGRRLRRELSGLLSTSEKESIEQTFESTEEALQHVAKLVENTRVDQQIHGGKVGFRSRMQFVLRDSPNIVRSVTFTNTSQRRLFFLLIKIR